MALLGLDCGTTGVKALVFAPDGRVLGQAYEEYQLTLPRAGWIELDSDRVWEAVRRVIQKAVTGHRVTAMSIAVHGEAVTPIAADGRALANSIITFDSRTAPQARWWEDQMGSQRFYRITGHPLHAMGTIHKLMWWRDNEPAIFAEARWFLCYEDLLWYRLGLEPAMGTSLAARTQAYDLTAGTWSTAILDMAGVDAARLASPVPAGTVIGRVTAPDLGLADVLAVAGGHDQALCALGGGAVRSGLAVNNIGTAEVVTPAFDRPVLSEALRQGNLACYPHAVPGMYVVLGIVAFSSGALLRWYRDRLGAEERAEALQTGRDVYDLIVGGASDGPSPVLVLPHFAGTGTPALDPHGKGALVGLTLSTTRGEIVKGMLDSLTYELRLNLDLLAESGVRVEGLRAIGGGSRSARWLQLKSDILGVPIAALDVSEAGCLGAAILAGTASGAYRSAAEGAEATVRVRAEYEPAPDAAAHYQERYMLYRELYPRLKEISHRL